MASAATRKVYVGQPGTNIKEFQLDGLESVVSDLVSGATTSDVHGMVLDNSKNSLAATFLKIFNVASGSVTIGTTDPNMQINVPGGGTTKAVLVGDSFDFGANSSCAALSGKDSTSTADPASAFDSVIITDET